MPSPLVSIITVTLNPGEALQSTIESIKAQTCRDFEHLVKDAGSRDGSVARYAVPDGDYRPTVIVQPDKGIYEAMNQALAHATGKYVLFLNAGDRLCAPETLALVAQAAARAPAASLIYGNYMADTLGTVVKSPARLSRFTLYRNTLCHQICFAARERMQQVGGFDATMRILADYDMLLRLLLADHGEWQYIDQPLAQYMGGGVSANPRNNAVKHAELALVRQRHFSRAQRLLYGGLLAATLPGLRNWLMQAQGLAPLQRAYVRLANLWNQ